MHDRDKSKVGETTDIIKRMQRNIRVLTKEARIYVVGSRRKI